MCVSVCRGLCKRERDWTLANILWNFQNTNQLYHLAGSVLPMWDKLARVANDPFRSSTHYSAGVHVSLLSVLVLVVFLGAQCMEFLDCLVAIIPGLAWWPSLPFQSSISCNASRPPFSLCHIVGTVLGNVVSKIKDLYPFWKNQTDLSHLNEERVVMRKDLAQARAIRKNTIWSRQYMVFFRMQVKVLTSWSKLFINQVLTDLDFLPSPGQQRITSFHPYCGFLR